VSNNALQPWFIHDTAWPLIPYCLHCVCVYVCVCVYIYIYIGLTRNILCVEWTYSHTCFWNNIPRVSRFLVNHPKVQGLADSKLTVLSGIHPWVHKEISWSPSLYQQSRIGVVWFCQLETNPVTWNLSSYHHVQVPGRAGMLFNETERAVCRKNWCWDGAVRAAYIGS